MAISLGELLQQMRDDMVSLLSRRTGDHLHETLGDMADAVRTARSRLIAGDEYGDRQVRGLVREDLASGAGGQGARVTDIPDLSGVRPLSDLMHTSVGEADNATLTDALKGLEQRYGPYRVSDIRAKYVVPRGAAASDPVRRVDVMGSIVDDSGKKVGKLARVFEFDGDDRLVVHNLSLKLDKSARGKGFSTSFTAAIENYYRRSGVDRIELMATDKDGGLAWARAGYTWNRDRELLADSVDNITQRIGRFAAHASPADRELLNSLLQRFTGSSVHYPEPGEIAMLRGGERLETW